MSSWVWDASLNKYSYRDEVYRRWVYDDNECIRLDESTLTTKYTIDPHGAYQTVQDPKLWLSLYGSHTTLFRTTFASLHFIDLRKERISLLVCQHILRPCNGSCEGLWTHPEVYLSQDLPTMAVYLHCDTDAQTLVIDLGSNTMNTRELIEILKVGTKRYRAHISTHLTKLEKDPPGWKAFHDHELAHYKWFQVPLMPANGYQIPGTFFVSGIICPKCERWTKLGSTCSRCAGRLKDESDFEAEDAVVAGIIGGSIGALGVIATAATYMFLSLLLML